MKPNDLPRLGIIENYDRNYIQKYVDLSGKRVLCLGYSEDEIDQLVAPLNPSCIEVMTLWLDHVDAKPGKYQITIGDICQRTSYADETFDAVLTLSLLEHVNPLEDALKEMKRITRRNGDQCHMFGPVWSSAYGSHLYMHDTDALLNFSKWQLPAFMHLLCSPDEIRNFYVAQGYVQAMGDKVVEQMFSDNFINRVNYDEYIRLMSRYFVIQNAELMTVPVPEQMLEMLRKTFPNVIDFSTYGGKYHLRLPK